MVEEVEYKLFHSDTDRDLKLEYPELAGIEEFKKLTSSELRLCWLIGNSSSPIFNLKRTEKIKEAMETVYGMGRIESKPDLLKLYHFKNGEADIPENVLNGINRMLHFNPDNRLRAKLLSQYMFDVMNKIVVVDKATLLTMDMDDKKKYAELMIKVNSELPKMIDTLESGFGIKLVSKKTGKIAKIDINKLHS